MRKLLVSGFLALAHVSQAFAESATHVENAHHGAHDAGHHSSGGLPQLDPSSYPSQIFWLLIVFGFLYVFFSKKSLPEISSVIEDRKERIQNDLDSAEKLRAEVDRVQAAYEESLAGARSQATQSYKDAEIALQKTSEERLSTLKDKAIRETEALEKRISSARVSIKGDMDLIAAEIAVAATEKIIDVRVDAKEALGIVSALNKPQGKTSKAA